MPAQWVVKTAELEDNGKLLFFIDIVRSIPSDQKLWGVEASESG